MPARCNNMYYVYVLLSKKDGNFYIGYTANLKERVKMHNKGQITSIKNRLPFELVYFEASFNQKDSLTRERYLKTTYGRRYIKNRIRNYFNNL